MRKKLFFTAVLLTGLAALAPAQTPDLILNPGSSYVEVGRSIPWGAPFNRTYVFVPNAPNASVCIYVVNNNPTNAHSFTTATFQTADSQAADYSNNTRRYNGVNLLNIPTSVNASSMVSGFTQSTAAAKVAIQFSGSSPAGGSPDTADLFLVQTTSGTCGSSTVAIAVQGPVATGANGSQVNPNVCGGLDQANLVQPCGVYKANVTGGAAAVNGIALGAPNQNETIGYIFVTMPNGNGGPLAVAPYATSGSQGSSFILEAVNPGPYHASATCSTVGVGCSGLFVSDTGMMDMTNVPSGVSQFFPIGINPTVGTPISVSSCRFDLNITSVAGVGATVDVYIQDSVDNLSWTDRIHFPQVVTGGTLHSWAAFNSNQATTTINPYTGGTLAANTVLPGNPGKYFRGSMISTNTPTTGGTLSMNCK